MSVYLGYSRPCSPLKDTFSAFEEEKNTFLPLSPLDTSSTESSSPPASHDENSFLLKDEPNELFSNYLQIPNEIEPIAASQDMKNLLRIKVLGIPETGAKSRVETQIKLCIQLTNDNQKITDYSFLRLQNKMLARSRLKKLQQQQNSTMIVAEDSKVLDLEAKVITSRTDQPIRMCVGCVRRERKRAERTKDKSVDEMPSTLEEERDRILIFNCNPMINFNSGDAILPTRITCYCRHHDEKLGFRVCFVMRNDKGEIIASGMSAPILITDDHKSSKKKKENSNNSNNNRKRARSTDNNQTQPDTPLHTPKSEKEEDIMPNDEVSNMFQESYPFNQRRRTNASGQFVSLPTTPLTEKDDFALLSDLITTTNNCNQLLPFTTTTSFIPSASVPEQSTSSSTSTSSSSLSLSSLSSSILLQQEAIAGALLQQFTEPTADSTILNESILLSQPTLSRAPQIDRLVPSQGPIYGGIEISILGSGFHQGLHCVFGEQLSTTLYWSENTMVCLLPPTSVPGPVVVSFKEHPFVLEQNEICIFTYYDASDQALLELALQLVGMKSTGKLQDAKQVAMGIIVQGKSNITSTTNKHGHTMLHLFILLKDMDLIKLWIEQKLSLDMQDHDGMTALHLACQLGSFEMVKLLLDANADPNIKNKDGHLARFFIPFQDDVIKELLLPPPKRKSLSRRSSMKGSHLTHRFHSLTKETKVEETTAPTMESDGLGFVQPKLDKRLYLFWLPVLIVAIGLLFVQLMGHPTLFEPLLEKMPHRLSFTV